MQKDLQNNKPLSDLMYDWVSILHAKSKALQAYDKYLQDAQDENSQECIQLLTRLREADVLAVQEVRDHLAEMFETEDMNADAEADAGMDVDVPLLERQQEEGSEGMVSP